MLVKLSLSMFLSATKFTADTTLPLILNFISPNFCPSKIGAFIVSSKVIS